MIRMMLLAVSVICSGICMGQYMHKKDTNRFHYETGEMLRLNTIHVIRAKKRDAYEDYRKTIRKNVEYYKDGTVKAKTVSVVKGGTWGRPCNEILYERHDYDEKGHLLKSEKRKCDKRKSVLWSYDSTKKLKFKDVKRVKYYKGWEAEEEEEHAQEKNTEVKTAQK